jgi:hypothetical protein
MQDLPEDPRPVAMDRVDAPTKLFPAVLVPGLGQDPCREPRSLMHGRGPGDDQSNSTPGPFLLESDVPIRHATRFDQARSHWQLYDAIPDRH